MPLIDKLRNPNKVIPQPKVPLWEGPESSGKQGGITQSLLARFLSCRERFRLKVIEGFRTVDAFNHRMEYGNMWHVCEEAFAMGKDWEADLKGYCLKLLQKYPLQRQQIEHWYQTCRLQFPEYVRYWEQHPWTMQSVSLMAEQVFKVPYKLPSGRTVYLRGKYDGVDLIGE